MLFTSAPWFLPGEAKAPGLLFAAGNSIAALSITFKNLETNESAVLVPGFQPVFSPTGHILYQTGYMRGGLWALPFSIETLTPTAEPFPIAEGLARPSVALDGTLVAVDSPQGYQRHLIWVDRASRKLGVIGRPQTDILYPWLSPDGRRVVVSATEGGNQDIWIHEVDRALATRLTFDPGAESYPKWSPSGEEIAYSSTQLGLPNVFSRASDGSGEPVSLVSTGMPTFPSGWSRDEKYFLYVVLDPENGQDIWWRIVGSVPSVQIGGPLVHQLAPATILLFRVAPTLVLNRDRRRKPQKRLSAVRRPYSRNAVPGTPMAGPGYCPRRFA